MRTSGILMGLFAETPLHPGTGSTTGVVDLPVQRERHTGFPIMQASGLKGAMREAAERKWPKINNNGMLEDSLEVKLIFGPADSEHAGSVAITDARILAFPVRSLAEVYVWVTCPMVIDRLKRDAAIMPGCPAGLKNLPQPSPAAGKALTTSGSGLGDDLILEEMLFKCDDTKAAEVKECADEIVGFLPKPPPADEAKDAHKAVREKMQKHLVVIPDYDFTYLVKNATQVSARIKLNDNKTSENLWYEETLPPDTLFYTMIMASKPRKEYTGIPDADGVIAKLREAVTGYLQIGGNETVGMGWCAVSYYGG